MILRNLRIYWESARQKKSVKKNQNSNKYNFNTF